MSRILYVLFVALALLTVPVSAHSGEGDVSDPRGDVAPEDAMALAPAGTVPPELTGEEFGQVGDLVSAHITGESANAFAIVIELAEIPDHDENVTSPIAEVWAHFTIKSQVYHAAAVLAMPPDEGKLEARHFLYRGAEDLGEIQGQVDAKNNTVIFIIDKARVGNPGFGDTLTKFYLTTVVPGTQLVLDYAPNAQPLDPEAIDPFNPQLLPGAQYGSDYAFGKYAGAVPADLDATVTPQSLMLEAGQQGTVSVTLKNSAQQADTVTLASGNVPPGWQVRFDTTSVTLQPGQSRIIVLYVVPHSSASGQSLVTLRALSQLGADQEQALSVQVTQPAPQQSPSSPSSPASPSGQPASPATGAGGGAGQDGAQQQQAGGAGADEENGAPLPSPLVLLAALGCAAALLRRRE